MPGIDATLIRRLTVAGWLLLGGEIGFVLFQLDRARSVDGTRFATAWDQRIEVLSFIVLPPNLTALLPGAVVAVVTTWLAGSARSPWLNALLRLVAGVAVTLMFVGVASIVEISTRTGQGSELDAVFLRLGGVSMAAGIAAMCRIADLAAPHET